MANATERVGLGSAIAYAFAARRSSSPPRPATSTELSGGRLILGLGTGTRRNADRLARARRQHPARHGRARPARAPAAACNEGPVTTIGLLRLQCIHRAVGPPLRADLPIYMAGVNPRMIQAAGTVGDGLVGHPLFTAEYVRDVVRPALARGAERAAATPRAIAGYLTCSVDDDRDAARQAPRRRRLQLDGQDLRVVHQLTAGGARRAHPRRLDGGRLRRAVER